MHDDEDEDGPNTPRGKWAKLQAEIMEPNPILMDHRKRPGQALSEALYTYSETHELRIDPELALTMWAIVEWAKTASPDEVEAIRL